MASPPGIRTAHWLGTRVWQDPARRCMRVALLLRRAALTALDHDVFTVAQATAYSSMVALFPGLIVVAALISMLPTEIPLREQMAVFFAHVLPNNVMPLLRAYFVNSHSNVHTTRVMVGAALVSLSGSVSVMARLMVGFRQAWGLQGTRVGWLAHWLRALCLVPLSLLPMSAASALVVFGRLLTVLLTRSLSPELQLPVKLLAFGLRWAIALAGSTAILTVIYHLGTDLSPNVQPATGKATRPSRHRNTNWARDWLRWAPGRPDWRASLPGAAVATVLWFLSTLGFGIYVTRFANYSRVYGSLGAAIALLFWLFLIALCVLLGAEYNAQAARWSTAVQPEARLWKRRSAHARVRQVE